MDKMIILNSFIAYAAAAEGHPALPTTMTSEGMGARGRLVLIRSLAGDLKSSDALNERVFSASSARL
jgi:hypothetical protein